MKLEVDMTFCKEVSMNNANSLQCGEAIVTNLVEISKEELSNIQTLIGIGLAKIAKSENLTGTPGDLTLLQQNKTRTEIETPSPRCNKIEPVYEQS